MVRVEISPSLGSEERGRSTNTSIAHVNIDYSQIRIDVRIILITVPKAEFEFLCSSPADVKLLEITGRLIIH
jgi:hypothetical protein